ncbi:MAG: hypothetical protein KBC56_03425 [Flavobacterium sp.]|nr:hypothetical protein [Flavobacterium sp.]
MKTSEEQLTSVPFQLISQEKAKELNSNFSICNEALSKEEDANALWYSLETLENYIAYVKNEGITKGYDIEGIRFYFGKYSENEPDGKAGYTTLFLTPTGKLKTEESESNVSSKDIIAIQPMNFGGMGNPPKMKYGE